MPKEKIDFRSMTRNFLRGESDVQTNTSNDLPGLLTEAEDRRLLIVREASRIRNMFNSTEIERLVEEINRR
jgi:hypothetical protein